MLAFFCAILMLLSGGKPVQEAPRVEVRIDRTHAAPGVAVVVEFPGDSDGASEVSVSEEWGGISGAAADIANLAALDERGSTLVVERAADHRWSIRHEPGARVRVTYFLSPGAREPLADGHNDFRTIATDEMIFAIGHHALALPDHIDGEAIVGVEWEGFDGWHVASSLGPGAARIESPISGDDLRSCLFIAGAPGRMNVHERALGEGRVGVAIVRADWGFDDGRFLDLTARILDTERAFFDDRHSPWYLVALTPRGRAEKGSFSLGGTGLTHCFALSCDTGLDLTPGSGHELRMLLLLAHECLHEWNGRIVRVDGEEGSAYWFSEGFTDYLSRRLLRDSGLISESQYLDELNTSLARYDANPAREAPNNRIVREFWTDPDVSELPYRRGDLLALAIDEYARRSNQPRSIDSLMRDLAARGRGGHPPIPSEELINRLGTIAPQLGVEGIRAVVLDGAPVPLPDTLEDGTLALREGKMREYDPGLDVERSRSRGLVVGIVPGSGAAEACLTEGAPMKGVRTLPGVADGPPRMEILLVGDDGSERTLTYDAVGSVRVVRRYVPAE